MSGLHTLRSAATMGGMEQPAVSMVSLGCAKNLVDSERMLAALVEAGWLVAERPRDADLVLINTCGFIEEARDESFGVIDDALKLKQARIIRGVVVVGCMVQLMRGTLAEEFPEVDAWVGVAEPGAVVAACRRALDGQGDGSMSVFDPGTRVFDAGPRLRVTPKHLAYLRIAEGCDNRCRYCQIPSIRGPLRSRPEEAIVREARELVADGARELIVIAQDTTNYGLDVYGERRLPGLLRRLREVEGVRWLRLLYAHPAHVTDELIAVLAEGGVLLPYIDLPVQHASDRILEAMGRGIDGAGLREVIGWLRESVPGIALRTSVIVGFPGEGEEEFAELLGFLREVRFDRLGAFAYSREDGTPAAGLGDDVSAEVKEERLERVMELQQEIVDEASRALVGQEIDVVVDGRGHDGEWAGRTVRDAPDVDGGIKFEEPKLRPGMFGRAVVTGAYGYDLTGRMTEAE